MTLDSRMRDIQSDLSDAYTTIENDYDGATEHDIDGHVNGSDIRCAACVKAVIENAIDALNAI